MDPTVREWLSLAVRWLHAIAGIAWIGTSFYFIWLDASLAAPEKPVKGVAGELWSVHGGGFYRVQKFVVAPERMPATLHWFKWEAYTTLLSGLALLVIVYYLGGAAFMAGPAGSPLGRAGASAVGVAVLIAGWLVYDLLCRSPLAMRGAAFSLVGLVLTGVTAYGLSRVMSGRAAYIHVGAMLGTIMALNVFRVIIPSQKQMVAALERGAEPDERLGRQAKARSVHNNYLTLPVVFVMVSNHYPMTYGSVAGWAILIGLSVIGGGVRHFFNLKNRGVRAVWILPAAAAALVALAIVTAPRPPAPRAGAGGVSDAAAAAVIGRRCVPCHSAAPTEPGVPPSPGGITLDTPGQVRAHGDRVLAVAVTASVMPPGNVTGMTPDERELLGRWIRGGIPAR